MIDEEILFILTNELTGQASEEEIERLNEWLHESSENEALGYKFRQAFINGKYTIKGKNADLAFQKLSQKISLSKPETSLLNKRNGKFPFGKHWLRNLAAVIMVVFSVTVILKHQIDIRRPNPEVPLKSQLVTKSNPKGQKSLVILPDGSTVKLNAESYIEYPGDFSDGRQLKLVGEAFFTVVRDTLRPFVVTCSDVKIRVLGTSFNVQAYPFNATMSVAVASGAVRIEHRYKKDNEQLAILSPNELIRIDHKTGKFEQDIFNPDELFAWKEGILLFRQASFGEIVQQLERWYGVEFIIKRTAPITSGFTGHYVNVPLDVVLEGMSFSSDFKFEIDGDTIYIN